jgi:hypothetical protein
MRESSSPKLGLADFQDQQVDSYVNVPLEPTYQAAHRGLPLHLRQILDGLRDPEPR